MIKQFSFNWSDMGENKIRYNHRIDSKEKIDIDPPVLKNLFLIY